VVAASYTGKYLREFLKDGRDGERVVARRRPELTTASRALPGKRDPR